MPQNRDSDTTLPMKVLHLLRDGPEPAASRVIAAHAQEHQVKVVDLRARDVSYEDVVDQIFAHDRVICW